MKPYYETELGKLYHGDCLEIMPYLAPVDLVLTDPPYDTVSLGGGIGNKRKYLHEIENNKINVSFDFNILDKFKNWFCFCAIKQLPILINKALIRNWALITWGKTNPTPLINNNYLPDAEYIVHSYEPGRLFGKYKDKSRFSITRITKNSYDHPTVKPIHLIYKCLNLGSEKGDTILDPFIGSGTTAIACERLKRKWIGIEIEEKYCEIAAKRIKAERQQLKLF
jgi:site-specific DNA-methyltransferase (adenine-specific)